MDIKSRAMEMMGKHTDDKRGGKVGDIALVRKFEAELIEVMTLWLQGDSVQPKHILAAIRERIAETPYLAQCFSLRLQATLAKPTKKTNETSLCQALMLNTLRKQLREGTLKLERVPVTFE